MLLLRWLVGKLLQQVERLYHEVRNGNQQAFQLILFSAVGGVFMLVLLVVSCQMFLFEPDDAWEGNLDEDLADKSVQLVGIRSKPELNGLVGVVKDRSKDADSQAQAQLQTPQTTKERRWQVQITLNGVTKMLALKRSNLQLVERAGGSIHTQQPMDGNGNAKEGHIDPAETTAEAECKGADDGEGNTETATAAGTATATLSTKAAADDATGATVNSQR